VESSPAVVNGVVYVGSTGGYVYALNASAVLMSAAKRLIWSYKEPVTYSTPAVVRGVVYVGSTDYNVTALNATTGALVWNYTTRGSVESSPAVAGGIVYVGSFDNNLYALNATTGALVWKYTAVVNGVYFPWFSSPAVARGVVYVGSDDDKIYAFGVHSVSCIHVVPSYTVVFRGSRGSINVTVANQGSYTETFTVTVYANTTAIATQTVTLTIGASTTIAFTWNTTGFAYGNYAISANVALAPSETNNWTGPFTDGTVTVSGPASGSGGGRVYLR
jgi:outer membrane protein assembly factor BamB